MFTVNSDQPQLFLNYLFYMFKVIWKRDGHSKKFLYTTTIYQYLCLLKRNFFKTESVCLESSQKSLSSASAVPLTEWKIVFSGHMFQQCEQNHLLHIFAPTPRHAWANSLPLIPHSQKQGVVKQCYWVLTLKETQQTSN